KVGGKDEGPAPGDLLCMSLASCKAITLRMYVQRKKWLVDVIKVKVDFVKAADTETGNNTFYCTLELTGDIDEVQKTRLMEIYKAVISNFFLISIIYLFPSSITSQSFISAPSIAKRTRVLTLCHPCLPAAPGFI